MAEVVTRRSLPAESIKFGGGVGKMKRKTITELKAEQLKRQSSTEIADRSAAPLLDSFKGIGGIKKSDFPNIPRYKDTRLGDVYQVKKSRMLMLKENTKDGFTADTTCGSKTIPNTLNIASNEQQAVGGDIPLMQSEDAKDDADAAQGCPKPAPPTEKINANTFRSVAELSLGNGRFMEERAVDIGKALKGLASKVPVPTSVSSGPVKWPGHLQDTDSINLCHELTIHGPKAPLDLTLKTYIRVVSSSSVRGIHRSILGSTYNGMSQCCIVKKDLENQVVSPLSGTLYNSKALCSWVYPQSSLPPSVISAFQLSASTGVEIDFLNKRHLDWEDAFRCLYYMLRKNACNIFYVCTVQFVVMFTCSPGNGKAKNTCHAYISKSTRGLRSLLKEHDVCFSMPLCQSRVEEATMEDLVELSEIEKQNLGQTRRVRSSADVDGTPKSLLLIEGNQYVHGLYDFMLNYRSLLPTMIGSDVPVLYSPIMFESASMHKPEIQCKELNKLDHTAKESYSVEVRDTYLPPWITYNLCSIMGSDRNEFEASFTTEPASAGLNIALQKLKNESEEIKSNDSSTFEIPGTFIASEMCSAMLKSLKYHDKSFSASLSRV